MNSYFVKRDYIALFIWNKRDDGAINLYRWKKYLSKGEKWKKRLGPGSGYGLKMKCFDP